MEATRRACGHGSRAIRPAFSSPSAKRYWGLQMAFTLPRRAPPEIFQQAQSEDAQPCGTSIGWTPGPYGPEECPMGLTIAPHLTKHTLVTRERPRRMREGLRGTTHDPTRLALSNFECAPHSHSTEPQKRKARSEQTSLTWPHKHNNSMAAGVDLTANSHRQAA